MTGTRAIAEKKRIQREQAVVRVRWFAGEGGQIVHALPGQRPEVVVPLNVGHRGSVFALPGLFEPIGLRILHEEIDHVE